MNRNRVQRALSAAGAMTSDGVTNVASEQRRALMARGLMLLVIVVSVLLCVQYWGYSDFRALSLLVPLCVAFAVAAMLLVGSSARSSAVPAGIGTLCVALIGLIGVAVPAQQLVAGTRVSILARLGVYSPNVVDDAPHAGLVFLLCLSGFALSELPSVPRVVLTTQKSPRAWEAPRLYWLLLIVGLLTTLAFGDRVSTDSLAARGQVNGQGVLDVLQQCYVLAVVLGVGNRHWGSRWMAGSSVATIAFSLAYTGSRSGLLIVVAALCVRWLHRIQRKGVSPLLLVGFVLLAYGSATFIVGFAQWRSAFRQLGNASLWEYLVAASADPIGRLASGGSLDTFDGLVLSLNVDRDVVGATIFDPLRGVINLIPSQLWQNKPGYLSPEVTHYYTDFGGQSGIFLSGPGYAYIVAAGVVGAAVFFVLLGFLFRSISSRYWHSPILVTIVLYVLFRFIVAGDSFDLQYGLSLLISLGIGRLLVLVFGVVDGVILR